MHFQREKNAEYWLVFRYSLLLTLGLLILIFYLCPRFSEKRTLKTAPLQISIYVSDIPQTHQPKQKSPLPPARPFSSLYVSVEDPDWPEEINLDGVAENLLPGISMGTIAPEIPAKSWLEVYPSTSGVTCKGYIRVLLLVNTRGQVETMEVIENTTMGDTCLALVKQAAYKSRWIPAQRKGQPVNSWVLKIYKFNLPK